MATRPGFIWSGTEWVSIGQEAVVNPFYYQATAPSTPSTGDIWIESDIDVPSVDSAQFLRWRKTMVGGETSLSGNGDSSLPLAYTPGYEQVYINGVLMVRGVDYTATTGTTITGLTALVADDVVEVFSTLARTVADVYTQAQADDKYVSKFVGGLNLIVPTSVTNGTVTTNGQVTIGSAVASVTVNGVFSSTYENYRILWSGMSANTASDLTLQLSGIPNSVYTTGGSFTTFVSATLTGYGPAATSRWAIGPSNAGANGSCDLYGPFATRTKGITSLGLNAQSQYSFNGYCSSTTSASGFVLAPTAGTLTGGTVRIYGYNNGA